MMDTAQPTIAFPRAGGLAPPSASGARVCKLGTRTSRDRSANLHRTLCAALAVAATCLVATLAVRGSERFDSGWAVAVPSPVLGSKQPPDPELRIVINHVLEQSHVPILRDPAPTWSPTSEPHVTQRPVVANGWRSAQIDSSEATPIVPKELGPRLRSAEKKAVATAQSTPTTATSTGPQIPVHTSNTPNNIGVSESGRPLPSTLASSAPADRRDADVVVTDESEDASEKPERNRDGPGDARLDEDEDRVEGDDESSNGPPEVVEPREQLPPLSRSMQFLRNKVRRTLKSYYRKPLNSREHDPWEMMHGMLAYGIHSRTRQNGPQGEMITSVGWLCYNKPCKRLTLLYATPEGELRAKQGVGLQGHMGQFLAMLAQCQVSRDYPIRVGEKEFAIEDLIEAEKTTCYTKTELTFKLISLMHYLDSDEKWVNDQGMEWDIPKLIHEELAQPIRGAACGGTHRLAGLSLAARTRVSRGEPLDGEYARAAQFVEKYHNYAFRLQNRDGSLSTEWFRGRGDEDDIDRRIKTTGHILEWLIYSLSDEQLRYSRTVRAVNYLSNLMLSNYSHDWEIGPRSHAIHALKLYDERMFQPYDSQNDEVVARPRDRETTGRARTRASSR